MPTFYFVYYLELFFGGPSGPAKVKIDLSEDDLGGNIDYEPSRA